MTEINKIIKDTLNKIACEKCQINLQSESAQIMIANKISEALDPHLNNLIEDIVVGVKNELPR